MFERPCKGRCSSRATPSTTFICEEHQQSEKRYYESRPKSWF
jgi:hypothetical protein